MNAALKQELTQKYNSLDSLDSEKFIKCDEKFNQALAELKDSLTFDQRDSLESGFVGAYLAYGLDAFLKGYEYALMMGGKES